MIYNSWSKSMNKIFTKYNKIFENSVFDTKFLLDCYEYFLGEDSTFVDKDIKLMLESLAKNDYNTILYIIAYNEWEQYFDYKIIKRLAKNSRKEIK